MFNRKSLLCGLHKYKRPSKPVEMRIRSYLAALSSFKIKINSQFGIRCIMISALAIDGQARRYLSKPIMERRSLASANPNISFRCGESGNLSANRLAVSTLFLTLVEYQSSFEETPARNPVSLPPCRRYLTKGVIVKLHFPSSLQPNVNHKSCAVDSGKGIIDFAALASNMRAIPMP